MSDTALSRCKDDHLDIVLDRRTAPATVAAGWEYIRFEHCALPELDLAQIDLRASLLGKTMRAPLDALLWIAKCGICRSGDWANSPR